MGRLTIIIAGGSAEERDRLADAIDQANIVSAREESVVRLLSTDDDVDELRFRSLTTHCLS